jgi:putative oxidoreductase
MKVLYNDYLHLIVRLLIGALFVYSAVPHVLNTMGLASSIYNYRLFSSPIIGLSAAFIPWISLLAGLALIVGVKVRAASLIVSVLLVIFISLAVISIIRGLDIDCGCFSGIARYTDWLTVSEDLIMLGCALFIFFFDRARISLASLFNKMVHHHADVEEAL